MLYSNDYKSKSFFTEFGEVKVDANGYIKGLSSTQESKLLNFAGFKRVKEEPKPEPKKEVKAQVKKEAPKAKTPEEPKKPVRRTRRKRTTTPKE